MVVSSSDNLPIAILSLPDVSPAPIELSPIAILYCPPPVELRNAFVPIPTSAPSPHQGK